MTFRPENSYRIFRHTGGDIMIGIRGHETVPSEPLLMYDGGAHGVLRRNRVDVVILDHIHPDVRRHIKAARQVTILELDTTPGAKLPKREYAVPVQTLDTLPFDFEALLA
jgi:hypothetical protein